MLSREGTTSEGGKNVCIGTFSHVSCSQLATRLVERVTKKYSFTDNYYLNSDSSYDSGYSRVSTIYYVNILSSRLHFVSQS